MARTISRGKKRFTIVLALVLAFTGVGVAFAYWTSSGTGDGEATTGQSTALTITTDPAVGTISPGGAGQTVGFTVTNPGPGIQSLDGVTVRMASATGVPWVPAGDCLIADYTATISSAPTSGEMAVGVTGQKTGTATVTLRNTGVNQDDCQDQVVPLFFEASPLV